MYRQVLICFVTLVLVQGCMEMKTTPEEQKQQSQKKVSIATASNRRVSHPGEKGVSLKEVQGPSQDKTDILNARIQVDISVSSTHSEHENEGPPSALLDGDLQTRWSSEYSAPQHIVLKWDDAVKLKQVKLHWETAAAQAYTVLASRDGESWRKMKDKSSTQLGPRVDNISLKGVRTRFLKLELKKRLKSDWGFSLYEIELIAPE